MLDSFIWQIGPYQGLPLRARVDLAAMAMEGYSTWQWSGAPHPQSPSITGVSASDYLVSYPRHSLGIRLPYQNVNYFLAIIWKEKGNKVNKEDLRGLCFV